MVIIGFFFALSPLSHNSDDGAPSFFWGLHPQAPAAVFAVGLDDDKLLDGGLDSPACGFRVSVEQQG
jgi:hypothetical protein